MYSHSDCLLLKVSIAQNTDVWCPHRAKTPESRWAHRSLQSVHYFSIVRVTSPHPLEDASSHPPPVSYFPHPTLRRWDLARAFLLSFLSLFPNANNPPHVWEPKPLFSPPPSTLHRGPWWRNLFLQHLGKCTYTNISLAYIIPHTSFLVTHNSITKEHYFSVLLHL